MKCESTGDYENENYQSSRGVRRKKRTNAKTTINFKKRLVGREKGNRVGGAGP
jgi:hypothetical protein